MQCWGKLRQRGSGAPQTAHILILGNYPPNASGVSKDGLGSCLYARLVRVRRNAWRAWYAREHLLTHRHWVAVLDRWYGAFRSFRGHIWLRLPKRWEDSLWEPKLERRGELLCPTDGSLCRQEGIERLQAKYPWVDIADLHMFLEGFREGERFGALGRNLNPPQRQTQSPLATSFGIV